MPNTSHNMVQMADWMDKYWQVQVAMHTPADRTMLIQSLHRTVKQAACCMFRMLHMYKPFQLPLRIDMSTARDRKRQIQGNFRKRVSRVSNEFQPGKVTLRSGQSGQCEMRQPIHHVSF